MQRAVAGIGWAIWLGVSPAAAFANDVDIENRTTPTRCAEEDNVTFALSGRSVARFQVEASPPRYLASIRNDVTAPDFSGCHFDGSEHPTDPRFHFTPRTRVLLKTAKWKIVGLTLSTFWRNRRVPVTTPGGVMHGVHLVQVFRKVGAASREVLVMYPSDGYWRIKPLPEDRFGDGLYGASVLIGPAIDAKRPHVDLAAVTIVAAPRLSLRLRFAAGGTAQVDIAEVNRTRTRLDVAFRPPLSGSAGSTFAMLRSMYVAPDNADVSEIEWTGSSDPVSRTAPIAALRSFQANRVRFGRSIPSRHNTSAPDIRFSGFGRAPAARSLDHRAGR